MAGINEDTKLMLHGNGVDGSFEILDDGLNWENPNKIYYWQGDELIIFKDDTFYSINPYTKKVKSVSLNEIKSELPDFYNYITQSFNYKILDFLVLC